MRRRATALPPSLLLLQAAALVGAFACGSSGSGASRVNPTYIEVDPAEFLGDIECANSNGALRYYVATLIDVTADDDGGTGHFRLPSSPPTSCQQSVFFSGVVAAGRSLGIVHEAHRYTAEIEGYESASLEPLHEGSSVMTSAGATVLPNWVGACGKANSSLLPLLGIDAGSQAVQDAGFSTHFTGPATPYPGRTVTLRGCSLRPLSADAVETRTRVRVDLALALGPLVCGEEPGQVSRFEVSLGGEVRGASCGEAVTFENLTPGDFLEFQVTAFEATSGADAAVSSGKWTTRCYQEPALGLELDARCDPLVASQ